MALEEYKESGNSFMVKETEVDESQKEDEEITEDGVSLVLQRVLSA